MMINRPGIVLCLLLAVYESKAQSQPSQSADTSGVSNTHLISSFTKDINAKADRINQKLDKYTLKALKKSQRQEARLKKKLEKTDSLKASTVFGNADQQYQQLQQRLQNSNSVQQYIPSLDTLNSSLKFLHQNAGLLSLTKETDKLKQSLGKVNALGQQFQKAEEIKIFLKERNEYIRNQLQGMGFVKELKQLNKRAFYYGEQLNEYKSLLKDHKKAEKKVIELLSKTKFFQSFFRKNSMLASLFRLPGDPDDPVSTVSLGGLQTRTQVNNIIQQTIAAGGPNAQLQFRQNIQDAQSQLQQLKDKVMRAGSSSDGEPKGFRPNQEKTRSFFKRLEYGTNVQTQKASNFFPVTTDLGLSVGYKLNNKSVVGIGASYKIGFGTSWKNINLSNEGIGLRTFIDWQLKGSFWLSGGYEQNYKTAFNSIDALRNHSAWQQSGLIGLSKVVSLKTKFFKKTRLQLLWDFLSYRQVPVTQPVVFRVGYNF